MNRILRVGWLVAVTILTLASSGLAAEPIRVPGPTVVLRAKGYDEPAFVPPRFAGAPVAKVQTADIEVTYNDFSAEAQAAFQYAVDIWSTLVWSPVTIRVEANWSSDLEEDVLGNARTNYVVWDESFLPDPTVLYPAALADALAGFDLYAEEDGEQVPDIVATFNAEFSDWYFGTDGRTPFGRYDFVTVVLHELCHGLGFSGSATVDDDGEGSWGHSFTEHPEYGVLAMNFDPFIEDRSGTAILDDDVFPNPSEVLGDVLQGNDLYWNGLRAVAVAGTRPRMYAPAVWEPGSSYSHLDEDTYRFGDPNSLMTPALGWAEAIHDPGEIALAMLQDMGWTTESSYSYWVAAAAQVSGENGSQWRTSLSVFNRSDAPATVELVYRRSGGQTATGSLSLPAGHQRVIDDVVAFLGSTGSGSLEVVSDQPLIVGTRTYNQSDAGTFGQYIDGVPAAQGVTEGGSVFLTMLAQNLDFRSNLGFTNTGTENARVVVVLYDDQGVEVTNFAVTIAPGANRQVNQPYLERGGRSDIRGGTAVVAVTVGTSVLVYGSVIDQLTGDATTIPAKR